MKILIAGDSFAADWTIKYPNANGWPNMLEKNYNVTNVAQCGVSEYKIYKQIMSVNIYEFDLAIIVHTSPYRIPTIKHPLYQKDALHCNCDLIFSDIEYHSKTFLGRFNKSLQTAYKFFIYHFDKDYQETTYNLYKEKINYILTLPTIIINDFSDWEAIKNNFWGNCNHLNEVGNKIIFQKIVSNIENLHD